MLNKDGDDHRRLRRLVTAAFTPRMVEQLRPRIEEIAHELIDAVAPRGEMDLVEKLPSRCRSRSSPSCSGSRARIATAFASGRTPW
jgi:hypothetical protein